MATMPRANWTDERLDDLSGRVDELSRRMDPQFDRLDSKIDRLSLAVVRTGGGMIVTMAIGVAGLLVN